MRVAVVLGLLSVAIAAPTWKLIDSDIATVDTGVAFVSDTVGYTSAVSNGAGPQILKTTNGGVNWASCPATSGLDILLLDIDATVNTIVVASVFGEMYSTNAGASFQQSTGGGTSQSVRYVGVNGDGGEKFGVTGQYFNTEGVGFSIDGGASFTVYDAKLTTEARYGAFPTDDTWYVAAGEWPSNGNDDDPQDLNVKSPTKYLSRRFRKSRLQKADGHMMRNLGELEAEVLPTMGAVPGAGYQAQITKTTDGGKTFKTMFNESNHFYFNSIDCQPNNENWCCAVGEGFQDSALPGGRIHCTTDGGASWNRTFWMAGTSQEQYSLMELRFTTDNDVWALGSELNSLYSSAWFLYSGDGGMTWTQGTTPMQGYTPLGLSFVDPTHAFAALDNTITQEAAIAVYE